MFVRRNTQQPRYGHQRARGYSSKQFVPAFAADGSCNRRVWRNIYISPIIPNLSGLVYIYT